MKSFSFNLNFNSFSKIFNYLNLKNYFGNTSEQKDSKTETKINTIDIKDDENNFSDFCIFEKEYNLLDIFKSYINDISPPINIFNDINEISEISDEELLKIIYDYQEKEINNYKYRENIVKNYLCENVIDFSYKKFIQQNLEITQDFRYFSIIFVFAYGDIHIWKIYNDIFPYICKFFSSANVIGSYKNSLLELKNLDKILEWIAIIPCYQFPLFLNEINSMDYIKYFILDCNGKHQHKEEYLKSFYKYKGVFTNHKELINILININKNYKLPKFNYDLEPKEKYIKYDIIKSKKLKTKIENDLRKIYEDFYFIINNNTYFKNDILNQLILKEYFESKRIAKNKDKDNKTYKLFLDFIDARNLSKDKRKMALEEFIPKLYLVFYYYLSYLYSNPFVMKIKDVKKYIEISIKESELKISIGNIINECYEKINKNQSILNEKIVRKFHELLIKFISLKQKNINFYQYFEYLSDFDFCLVLFLYYLDEKNENKDKNYCYYSLFDNRINIMNFYKENDEFINKKKSKELTLNESLLIKFSKYIKIQNLLVIYKEKNFLNFVKSIPLPYNIKYIERENLDDFFDNKIYDIRDENNFRVMKFYVLIEIEIYNELNQLFEFYINSLGLSLVFIVFYSNNSLISKKLKKNLAGIFVNSKVSISEYFNDIKTKYMPTILLYLFDLKNELENIDKKFLFKLNQYACDDENNGWELMNSLNLKSIAEQCYIFKKGSVISALDFCYAIYELYKENDILDLFSEKYAKFFFPFSCLEEKNLITTYVKQVIYCYTCDEGAESFYKMMNNDLKSGEMIRIKRYICLIYSIKQLILNYQLTTYDDIPIFRGTNLVEEQINNMIVGDKIFNSCFCSFSKRKEIAVKFIMEHGRNVLLISYNNKKNNIDLFREKISSYLDEEEVLILPFSCFQILEIIRNFFDEEKKINYNIIKIKYIEQNLIDDQIINLKLYDKF